jgi:hypothetical protein
MPLFGMPYSGIKSIGTQDDKLRRSFVKKTSGLGMTGREY